MPNRAAQAPLKAGDKCLAQSGADKQWYRAAVERAYVADPVRWQRGFMCRARCAHTMCTICQSQSIDGKWKACSRHSHRTTPCSFPRRPLPSMTFCSWTLATGSTSQQRRWAGAGAWAVAAQAGPFLWGGMAGIWLLAAAAEYACLTACVSHGACLVEPQVRPMPPALAAVPGQAQQACIAFVKVRSRLLLLQLLLLLLQRIPSRPACACCQQWMCGEPGPPCPLPCTPLAPALCGCCRPRGWRRSTVWRPPSSCGSWWEATGA